MRFGSIVWGMALVLVGLIFLGIQVGWWSSGIWADLSRFWPVILVALGLRLLLPDGGFIVAAVLLFSAVVFGLIYGPRTLVGNEAIQGNRWFNMGNTHTSWSFGRGFSYSGEKTDFKSELSTANTTKLALNLGGPYNVTVKGADVTTVNVDLNGPKELIDDLSFTPEGDQLVLKENGSVTNWTFFGMANEVTGTITVPKNLALAMDLSGIVKVSVDGHSAPVTIKGSGATRVSFANSTTTNPNVNLSGAGQINMDKCQGDVDFELSGAGKIDAKDCTASTMKIRTSGAGQITVNGGTITDLDVRTSGASRISVPKPTGKITQDNSGASKVEFK